MVDVICDGEQIMEARPEAGVVWMACEACGQVRLATVGLIAQRSEQGTHNALVLGSNPSGPITIIPIQ